ncbi:MAG: hypothetical protein KAT13_01260 [Methanosarcinales archaeon]|nr:hypothetical protein [Methanosarcinales archaeon]MCK4651701.1 hypothetical protein [Methanosarcinales archaeon]
MVINDGDSGGDSPCKKYTGATRTRAHRDFHATTALTAPLKGRFYVGLVSIYPAWNAENSVRINAWVCH